MLSALSTLLLVAPCEAVELDLGAELAAHGSMGLKTEIRRVGVEPGLSLRVGGEHHGLGVDLSYPVLFGADPPERFPALGLSWSMAWGEGPLRPYHNLGAGLWWTGTMDTALTPALPVGIAGGGVEWRHGALWLRGGLQGFFAPAPALGLGPRLTVGFQL